MAVTLVRSFFDLLAERRREEQDALEVRQQAGFFRRFSQRVEGLRDLFPLGMEYEGERMEDDTLRPPRYAAQRREGPLLEPDARAAQRLAFQGIAARGYRPPGPLATSTPLPPEEPSAEETEALRQQAIGAFRASGPPVQAALTPEQQVEQQATWLGQQIEAGRLTRQEAERQLTDFVQEVQGGNVRPAGPLGEPSLRKAVFEPFIPEAGLQAVEQNLGPLGRPVRRELEFLSTPVGLAGTARFPGASAMSALGGVAAGTAAEPLPIPEWGKGAIQAGGNIVAPGAGLVPLRKPGILRPRGVGPLTEAPSARPALEVAHGAPLEAEAVTRAAPLPERGTSGAEQALALKEETLRRPGLLTRLPGVKQVASGLNPSVSMDRQVLVSYNARQGVTSSLETEFAAQRQPVMQRLQQTWDASPPRYIGPKDNAIKGTIKDWADNPEFYSEAAPELRAAARAYDDVSNQILARTRGEFGVDIRPFFSGKEGAFYLPTVQSREALDKSLLKVSEGYTSSGVSPTGARIKTRVYEGAYQRAQKNPGFQAETDLAELTNLHDRALATMGGNETFRLGAGGKTRMELMQGLHPQLYNRMTGLRQRLTNLRGMAGRLSKRTSKAIDDFLAAPDGSLTDLADALDVTVKGRRADVAVAPGRIREVGRQVEKLRRGATVHRGRLTGADIKAVNTEIKAVRQEIRQLRPAWEAANLEPYVLNRKTFRYHMPEQSTAIDKVLLTKLPIGDGLLNAIDEVRLTAFGGDVSPLTIQGLLGVLSDPVTGARSMPAVGRALWRPESLLEIASREPDMVRRFTMSTGRPFGEMGAEFVQRARGIERIPIVGPELNRRLMSAVEALRYNQWKTDTFLVENLGGKTQAVADADAANALSKVIPALNPAERGASILQARVERLPVISTSFIGGPATVMKDAASGIAKLTASRALSPAARWQGLAGREQLAILHLASTTSTVVTASVGTHILAGWNPEDAVKETLDPNNPRFLGIAIGPKRYIPIGGPLRSAVRAFAPRKVGEVKGTPVYVPFVGVPQWTKGKVTPAIRAPVDIVRNADYFGGKIATGSFPENVLRAIWYGANSVLPLAAAEPSEAIRRREVEPTEIGKLAERSVAQLGGVDLREAPFRERTAGKIAEAFEKGELPVDPDAGYDQVPTRLSQLLPDDRQRFRELYPEVAEEMARWEDGGETQDYFDQIETGKERLTTEFDDILDRARQGGYGDLAESENRKAVWEAKNKREDNYAGVIINAQDQYPDVVAGFENKEAISRMGRLLQEARELEDRHPVRDTEQDWEEYEADKRAHFTDDEWEDVQRQRSVGDHELQQAEAQLQVNIEGYYDTDEDQRESWRRQNPLGDASLFLLGRVSRVMTAEAQQMAQTGIQSFWGQTVEVPRGGGRQRRRTRPSRGTR